MNLFDLHSDTLYEAKRRALSPISSTLLQAPLGVSPFEKTHRISAIWCDNTLDDEACYNAYLDIYRYTEEALCNEPLPERIRFTYAVEDARLLAGKAERLETLFENGVRVLTLTWQGVSSIGGAWDTESGLTDFGKALIRLSAELGMILDISHASLESAKETLALSERFGCEVIATHSCSFSVVAHKRNLTDYLFEALAERSAPVGINLVPYHLSEKKTASLDDMLSHIAHFLSLKNAAHSLALGSDFDGVSTLPQGIATLSDLPKLYRAIEAVFGSTLAERIFYQNAQTYFSKHIT